MRITLCCLICSFLCSSLALAPLVSQAQDLSNRNLPTLSEGASQRQAKTVDELLEEAQDFFSADHPIDARANLLAALEKAPDDYRPQMMLGSYYLTTVAHFQLALRYLESARTLLEKTYPDEESRAMDPLVWQHHARLLMLISDAQLNLDYYEKALTTLDEFLKAYFDPSIPASKAWILMKLGRLDDAIRTAQAGLLRDPSPGRTLNVLGILFSLKGNDKLALDTLTKAAIAELSLGLRSQLSTPLNNSAEVYREMFLDNDAEATWEEALKLPDGCSHILPSMNMVLLLTDQMRILASRKILDEFESCFANNPLRSDTEHRALLKLARGRLKLREGKAEEAVQLLQAAANMRQWFGKIGTSQDDMALALHLTLAQAQDALARTLYSSSTDSILAWTKSKSRQFWLRTQSAWHMRKARLLAVENLKDFEDIVLRNTDSMLEYATLGEFIATFPAYSSTNRLKQLLSRESNQVAAAYYKLYLASVKGDQNDRLQIINEVLTALRPYDALARAEALTLKIKLSRKISDTDVLSLFEVSPAHLLYNQIQLPAHFVSRGSDADETGQQIARTILASTISPREESAEYEATLTSNTSDKGMTSAEFTLRNKKSGRIVAQVSESRLTEKSAIVRFSNRIMLEVF
ncbi:MAG: hypothetical protein PHC51_14670, partial [bacterium]|nr:hypothetical protein [bacterium]